MVEVTDVDHVNVLRWLAGCQDDPSRRHALQKAAEALTTAQAEIEALKERNDALALQADEWIGKYAAVSEINEALRARVAEIVAEIAALKASGQGEGKGHEK